MSHGIIEPLLAQVGWVARSRSSVREAGLFPSLKTPTRLLLLDWFALNSIRTYLRVGKTTHFVSIFVF